MKTENAAAPAAQRPSVEARLGAGIAVLFPLLGLSGATAWLARGAFPSYLVGYWLRIWVHQTIAMLEVVGVLVLAVLIVATMAAATLWLGGVTIEVCRCVGAPRGRLRR